MNLTATFNHLLWGGGKLELITLNFPIHFNLGESFTAGKCLIIFLSISGHTGTRAMLLQVTHRGGRCSALTAVKRYVCTEKPQITLQVYICLGREQNTERETGRDVYGPTHHSRLKYQTAHVLTAPLLCATAAPTLLSLHHVRNPLVIVCCCAPAFYTKPCIF